MDCLEGRSAIFGNLFLNGDNNSGIKQFVSRGVFGGCGKKSSLYGVGSGVLGKVISIVLLLDLTIPLGVFEISLYLSFSILF